MSTTTRNSSSDEPRCQECSERFDTMDELVDHLTDEHDAFDWIVDGRPMRGDE